MINLAQIKAAQEAASQTTAQAQSFAPTRPTIEPMGSIVLLADQNSYVYKATQNGPYTEIKLSDFKQTYAQMIKLAHKGLANPSYDETKPISETNQRYLEPFKAGRYKASDSSKQTKYITIFTEAIFNNEDNTRTLACTFFFPKGSDVQELLSFGDYERLAMRIEECSVNLALS